MAEPAEKAAQDIENDESKDTVKIALEDIKVYCKSSAYGEDNRDSSIQNESRRELVPRKPSPGKPAHGRFPVRTRLSTNSLSNLVPIVPRRPVTRFSQRTLNDVLEPPDGAKDKKPPNRELLILPKLVVDENWKKRNELRKLQTIREKEKLKVVRELRKESDVWGDRLESLGTIVKYGLLLTCCILAICIAVVVVNKVEERQLAVWLVLELVNEVFFVVLGIVTTRTVSISAVTNNIQLVPRIWCTWIVVTVAHCVLFALGFVFIDYDVSMAECSGTDREKQYAAIANILAIIYYLLNVGKAAILILWNCRYRLYHSHFHEYHQQCQTGVQNTPETGTPTPATPPKEPPGNPSPGPTPEQPSPPEASSEVPSIQEPPKDKTSVKESGTGSPSLPEVSKEESKSQMPQLPSPRTEGRRQGKPSQERQHEYRKRRTMNKKSGKPKPVVNS